MNQNKYFIVTGAAKRLGYHISFALATQHQYNLVLHYNQSDAEVKKLQQDIKKQNPHIDVMLVQENFLDSTSSSQGISLIKKVVADIPKEAIAGLINNASLFVPGSIKDGANFINQINVNALAVYHLTNDYHNLVGSGHIINMLDSNIKHYDISHQNYSISKTLLQEITLQSAIALSPHIQVNAIAPGPTLPMPHESQQAFQKKVGLNSLFNHYTPNITNITKSIDFILSMPFLTGQIIYAGGGAHLQKSNQHYSI